MRLFLALVLSFAFNAAAQTQVPELTPENRRVVDQQALKMASAYRKGGAVAMQAEVEKCYSTIKGSVPLRVWYECAAGDAVAMTLEMAQAQVRGRRPALFFQDGMMRPRIQRHARLAGVKDDDRDAWTQFAVVGVYAPAALHLAGALTQ